MKKGLVYFLTILVVLGLLGVGAKFFVQQSAFASSSITVSSTGAYIFSIDRQFVQQSALPGYMEDGKTAKLGDCEFNGKTADCILTKNGNIGNEAAILMDIDLFGWRTFKSCAGFMNTYGCDPTKCNTGLTTFGGTSACTGSDGGLECSLASDCPNKDDGSPGTWFKECKIGSCQYTYIAENPIEGVSPGLCTYDGYTCTGYGALYHCVNGVETFYGNIYATRYACKPECAVFESSNLDAFCAPVEASRLTPDEQNLQDITLGEDNVKDAIEQSREWVEMPDPRCIFSFAECPTVKVPVIVDPLPVRATNKTMTSKTSGGLVGSGGLSWWTYFKLFAGANWILLVVLGGLILALVLTLTLTKKKRGK